MEKMRGQGRRKGTKGDTALYMTPGHGCHGGNGGCEGGPEQGI